MSERRVAEVALVGIAAVWGLTFVMVQDAIERLPTLAFLGYRFVPAALLVAAFSLRGLRGLSREGWLYGLALGGFLTAGYVFQTFGLEHTSASNAGFITGLFVVLTPLLGAIFLREHVGSLAWAAAAVSGFGLYLLSGGSDGFGEGDLLVLGCALAFAAHILVTSRAVARHDLGALLAIQLGVCGVACTLAAGVAGQLSVPRGGSVWLALAVTAFIASALGFFVQSYAQRHAPPARTALILASEPAFAGLFGWAIGGDTLSAVSWLGALLIMAAIVAVEVVPRLRPPRPLPEG